MDLMNPDAVTAAVVAAASSPWVYAAVSLLTLLDAFLVVVPSETVLVALGALALSTGAPDVRLLVPVAAVAAIAGDSLTYWLGRSVRFEHRAWARRRRVAAVAAWARRSLDRRAAAVLLTARFVPFGRIAVNLTAGASRFHYPRFLALTAVAGLCWSVYTVGVGALFGAWFDGNPLLGVAVSIVVALCLGFCVDRASEWMSAARKQARES